MSSALDPLLQSIRTAADQRQTLRIRGSGSKSFLQGPASALALDTQVLQGIVAYEPTELVVTALAGTPLAVLEAELAAQGQCLPFEPPHFGPAATVGGMVAAGLSGPARASVGAVRDYVLGIQIVNGQGELLSFGGQVMKNVAGYDVSRLMAGSRGELGLIVQVSLKVLPVAPAEATLCFPMPQAQALAQLQRWCGQPLPINASCWVRDDTQQPATDLLFVRLRGAVAAVEAACQHMLQDVPGQRMDNAQAGPDWIDCREQRLPFFTPPAPDQALWRLSVAPATPALDLPGTPLIEWHGGQRWLWAPASASPQLSAAAQAAGGHAQLWRRPADGSGADVPQPPPLSGAQAAIQARIKTAFDPHGLFA